MTRNEFANTIYRTKADMLRGIARAYWTSNGNTSHEAVIANFNPPTDGLAEAADCIQGWNLDFALDDRPEHMDYNYYTAEDLAAAMVAEYAAIKAEVEDMSDNS